MYLATKVVPTMPGTVPEAWDELPIREGKRRPTTALKNKHPSGTFDPSSHPSIPHRHRPIVRLLLLTTQGRRIIPRLNL